MSEVETIEQRVFRLGRVMHGKDTLSFADALNDRNFKLACKLVELAIAEEREATGKYRKACEGLPDGAIDGGWTALGMSSYAKRLEDALNEILCLNTDRLANAYIISGEVLALRFFPMYASAVEVRE